MFILFGIGSLKHQAKSEKSGYAVGHADASDGHVLRAELHWSLGMGRSAELNMAEESCEQICIWKC